MSDLRMFRKAGHAVRLEASTRDEADGENAVSVDAPKALPADA